MTNAEAERLLKLCEDSDKPRLINADVVAQLIDDRARLLDALRPAAMAPRIVGQWHGLTEAERLSAAKLIAELTGEDAK